jgi:hypothetical protein
MSWCRPWSWNQADVHARLTPEQGLSDMAFAVK